MRVSGTGVQLSVFGQTLSGNFTFARDATVPAAPVVTVSFSNVELGLGDGTTKFVRITNASGNLASTASHVVQGSVGRAGAPTRSSSS